MAKKEKEVSRFIISADEARSNVENSMTTVNRIYRLIREASLEGQCSLTYTLESIEESFLDHLSKVFKDSGFEVEYAYDNHPFDVCDTKAAELTNSDLGVIKISW